MKFSAIEKKFSRLGLFAMMKICMKSLFSKGHEIFGPIIRSYFIDMVHNCFYRKGFFKNVFYNHVRTKSVIIGFPGLFFIPHLPKKNVSISFKNSSVITRRMCSCFNLAENDAQLLLSGVGPFFPKFSSANFFPSLGTVSLAEKSIIRARMEGAVLLQILGRVMSRLHASPCLGAWVTTFKHFILLTNNDTLRGLSQSCGGPR